MLEDEKIWDAVRRRGLVSRGTTPREAAAETAVARDRGNANRRDYFSQSKINPRGVAVAFDRDGGQRVIIIIIISIWNNFWDRTLKILSGGPRL